MTSKNKNFYRIQDTRVYIGAGNLDQKLSPGSYSMKYDRNTGEVYIEQNAVASIDKTQKTTQMNEIINITTTFAANVNSGKFVKHSYKSKFGILLEGPPGTGKSQTVNCCINAFVEAGGIVIFVADNQVYSGGNAGNYLKKLNSIDANLPLMLILEDLDSVHPAFEVYLTSILDGEQSPKNTFFLGTTNYLAKISKRILRPGRFDLIYKVDGLTDVMRLQYIKDKANEFELFLTPEKVEEMFKLTDKYNFSEIRTFMAYIGFFGFDASSLAAKISRQTNAPGVPDGLESLELLDFSLDDMEEEEEEYDSSSEEEGQ
jgi:SpoVK/Ycf46/Vps4 family AAA+-type ATPase